MIDDDKTGVTASCRTVCRTLAKQDLSCERIKEQPPITPKHREERLKFARKHIVEFIDFKQVFFTDKKRFFPDGPDNISLYVKHRGDSVIAPHRVKRQMGDGGVMILGAISSFGNLAKKVIEGKYNSLKYLDDLRFTFFS